MSSKCISLCQDVMTGFVVIKEQTFFQKIVKDLFTRLNPITKCILKERIAKLYAFLTTMSYHHMCIPLAHAMTNTFLALVCINASDIKRILVEHNAEYSLEPNEETIDNIIRTKRCPYDEYFDHVLSGIKPKGVGTIKVVLVYKEGTTKHGSSQGVEFKLNIPFRSIRKKLYVDITKESVDKDIDDTTLTFIHTKEGSRFVGIPNNIFFNVNSPIGGVLVEYYKMWKVKEAFLAKVYSKYTQRKPYMFFTSL